MDEISYILPLFSKDKGNEEIFTSLKNPLKYLIKGVRSTTNKRFMLFSFIYLSVAEKILFK